MRWGWRHTCKGKELSRLKIATKYRKTGVCLNETIIDILKHIYHTIPCEINLSEKPIDPKTIKPQPTCTMKTYSCTYTAFRATSKSMLDSLFISMCVLFCYIGGYCHTCH